MTRMLTPRSFFASRPRGIFSRSPFWDDDFFSSFFADAPLAERERTRLPALEHYTRDGTLVARFDMPGVEPSDVEVTLLDDTLTVRGHRKEHREGDKGATTTEVRYERSVTVPEGIDEKKVVAHYDNGVLEVRMPLPEAPKPRKIPIEAAADAAA